MPIPEPRPTDFGRRLIQDRDDINALYELVDSRTAQLDSKIDAVASNLHVVASKVDALDSRIEAVDSKVGALDSRIEAVDSKVDALAAETGRRFDQLNGQISKILDLLSN